MRTGWQTGRFGPRADWSTIVRCPYQPAFTTDVNRLLTCAPSSVIPPTITEIRNANITAYSVTVAASDSAKNRRQPAANCLSLPSFTVHPFPCGDTARIYLFTIQFSQGQAKGRRLAWSWQPRVASLPRGRQTAILLGGQILGRRWADRPRHRADNRGKPDICLGKAGLLTVQGGTGSSSASALWGVGLPWWASRQPVASLKPPEFSHEHASLQLGGRLLTVDRCCDILPASAVGSKWATIAAPFGASPVSGEWAFASQQEAQASCAANLKLRPICL